MRKPKKKKPKQKYPSKFMVQWRHISVIDREIRRGYYPSAPKLAGMLELSDRTVKRHIHFMRWDLGAPIEYESSEKGYYYSEDDWSLPPIRVSEGELFAVVLAERALRGMHSHPIATKVQQVFNKIALQLPDEIEIDPGTLAGDVRFETEAVAPPNPEAFGVIAKALRENRTIEMTYYKLGADQTVERTVDPYAMRCIKGEWYLVGRSHGYDHVPIFHVGRIRDIKATDDKFDRDGIDFDADEYFKHSLGASQSPETVEVKIKFFGWAARYVAERTWHPNQKIRENKDGSVVLKMTVGWLDEVCMWIMGFGPSAKVMAPESLKDMVRERLKDTLAFYED